MGLERSVDHPPQSSAQVNSEYSQTRTPLSCLHGMLPAALDLKQNIPLQKHGIADSTPVHLILWTEPDPHNG